MCIFGKTKKDNFKPTPTPEAGPDPLEVGGPRKEEDDALFGGQPNLSVNRDSVAPGVASGGSGLRMM